MSNIACCYLLENNITKDQYIGVTENFDRRSIQHKYGSNECLKLDIKTYGWNNFSIKKLLIGSINYCYYLENKLINKYNCTKYNIAPGGQFKTDNSGEKNGRSKLKEQEVIKIRKDYNKTNISMQELANKYNVSKHRIYSIIHGLSWKDTAGPIISSNSRTALTEKDVVFMRTKYANKEMIQKDFVQLFNLSQQQVSRILRGERWKNAGGPIKGIDYD